MKSPQETLKNFIGNHSNYEKLEYFNKNISSIISSIKESNGKIAIVSDFDYTLTKRYDFQDSQVNFFSTYCVLENHKDVSENFRTKFKQLFETYRKYPVDLSIEFETRKNMVMKWYQENLELILEEGLTKAHFEEMIDQSHGKFFFRNGILELFEMVLNYKIPFFIISGGIYEIIEHALKTVIPFYNQLEEEKLINIIANRFTYDESSEKMIGYYQPVVYHFNKGEVSIFYLFSTKIQNYKKD